MTKSKSLSLASFQGTRPLSGTYIFLVFVSNGIPSGYPVIEPAAGFRMETILLAYSFLSFPLLFKHPVLRSFFRRRLLYRKQERLYILPSFFVNTLGSFFLFFFRIFFIPRSSRPVPLRGGTENNLAHTFFSVNSLVQKK